MLEVVGRAITCFSEISERIMLETEGSPKRRYPFARTLGVTSHDSSVALCSWVAPEQLVGAFPLPLHRVYADIPWQTLIVVGVVMSVVRTIFSVGMVR